MSRPTALLVVVTCTADATAMAGWLAPQLSDGQVTVVTGFHAAVAALGQPVDAVVANVGVLTGHEDWRLAELRSRQPAATLVVVADATLLVRLAATVHADVAVTRVGDLPPLRELLVTDAPLAPPARARRGS